jgi:cytochrome c biogenesis factor
MDAFLGKNCMIIFICFIKMSEREKEREIEKWRYERKREKERERERGSRERSLICMILFLVWLGIAVLLPIILFYVSHGKPRSVAVGSPSSAKEGAPRRNIQTSSSLKDR